MQIFSHHVLAEIASEFLAIHRKITHSSVLWKRLAHFSVACASHWCCADCGN